MSSQAGPRPQPPERGNREALLEALHCDLALSEGQIRRWYAPLSEREAKGLGLHVVQAFLTLSKDGGRIFSVRFYTPYRRVKGLGPHLLRHLAGVGEMRHLLGVPPSRWQTDTHRVHYRELPDAYWYTDRGPVAIEYDAGSYSKEQRRRKAETFALRFLGQCWGVPTPRLAEGLERAFSELGLEVPVLVAPWW